MGLLFHLLNIISLPWNLSGKKKIRGKLYFISFFYDIGEKHVNSPLMTPIVSEWLDFFSG
jgi:hypothetical protein